ncbi:MAG: MarR family transcriptional regulator [Chloroflexi bacterium]|nr:MarR family transcriptional regulator [Chloroflexota bacterium]
MQQTVPLKHEVESGEPAVVARELVRVMPALMRLAVAAMHQAPHTAGMTLAQFRVLARLSERDYRAAELAAALEVGRPTLTATTDHLEHRGLVERLRTVANDRRGVLLHLTPAGRSLYRTLEGRVIEALADRLEGIEPDDRGALLQGLRPLAQTLQVASRCAHPATFSQDTSL